MIPTIQHSRALKVLNIVVVASALVTSSATSTSTIGQHAAEVKELIDWFVARQGTYFNPKQEIRRAVPNDSSTVLGIFAAAFIEDNELLISIPWNTTINAGRPTRPDEGYYKSICDTVHNLVREMKLGNQSDFAPYAKHLLKQKKGQLPGMWSKEGRELLMKVLGNGALPPSDPFGWEVEWRQQCSRYTDGDALEEHAAMLVISRAEDDLMIPIYDMLSHRNGEYHNVDNKRIEREVFEVKATREIAEGEQLYGSYNQCTGCEARYGAYGTSDIFTDYGFVEQMPQRWVFRDHNFAFHLEGVEPFGAAGSSELRVKWGRKGAPSNRTIDFYQKQILRLDALLKKADDFNTNVPKHELEAIWEYADAILLAMKHVIWAVEEGASPDGKQVSKILNNDEKSENAICAPASGGSTCT